MRGSATRITALWKSSSDAAEDAAQKAETATNIARLRTATANVYLALDVLHEALAIYTEDRARNDRKLAANA